MICEIDCFPIVIRWGVYGDHVVVFIYNKKNDKKNEKRRRKSERTFLVRKMFENITRAYLNII